MEHWAKKIFEKIATKHVQNTFGHFWERFWAYLDFWHFFDCSQFLEDSTLHGKLGKNFSNKMPQNTFKSRVDTFGNAFGHLWNFENFLIFFESLRKLDPPWKNGPKIFGKLAPKLVQNTFGYFWERFWAFLEFWNFFDFFENFWRLDPPWNTGQKFRKNCPKITFRTSLDTYGTDFVHFCNFIFFFDFFENFRRLDLPWKTGPKIFGKLAP